MSKPQKFIRTNLEIVQAAELTSNKRVFVDNKNYIDFVQGDYVVINKDGQQTFINKKQFERYFVLVVDNDDIILKIDKEDDYQMVVVNE